VSAEVEVISSDVIVIGGGVAGLTAALYADGCSVTLLSKTQFGRGGSSVLAQGGVAVPLGGDDSPEQHAADTLAVACGLGDERVARLVTADGPGRFRQLLRLGARLDRDAGGGLALGREAAHSRRRVVHAEGDATGAELVRALAAGVWASSNIRIEEETLAVELLQEDGRVIGVLTVDRSGRWVAYQAAAVVLATGGTGGLYARTTNPTEATADGLAMAARAGAVLTDLEFVQFHPTALADGSRPMALLTEALRGEGAALVDGRGERFMSAVHHLAELAPRDVVARAIWRRQQRGEAVYLDATHLGSELERRFPTVFGLCRQRGLDPAKEPIPVSPAAHYHMGGVAVDTRGRTSLDGLWACGEAACTGLHGANRLASNSLLEALVYGARVGEDLSRARGPRALSRISGFDCWHRPSWDRPWLEDAPELRARAEALVGIMWRDVGVERSAESLERASAAIEELEARGPCVGELANMLLVAGLVTRAALAREESRGAHCRVDHPRIRPEWQGHLIFTGVDLDGDGAALRVAAG
jgi:L-aspartate oxidase